MLNLQSPIENNCRNDVPLDTISPPTDILLHHIAPAPPSALSRACSSDLDVSLQNQNLPSIKELDRLQRLRREELERRNAELQSIAVMNKLKNAGKIQSFPSMNSIESSFFKKNASSLQSLHYDSDLLDLMDDLGSDDDSMTLDCIASNVKARAPVPRLDIRPQRSFFALTEEPVVILPGDKEDKFGDLFPSPHSNKFVLQFPNAPSKELTLSDYSLEVEDEKQQEDVRTPFCPEEYVARTDVTATSRNEDEEINKDQSLMGVHFFRPMDPKSALSCSANAEVPDHSSNTSSSAECSPMPVEFRPGRKSKILLKPKKRRSHSTVDMEACNSPRSSSCSSFEEETKSERQSNNILPVPALPRSLLGERPLDEMTKDLHLNDTGHERYLSSAFTFSNCDLDRSGAFHCLRPRRTRKPSIVLKAPYEDDHGDELMELDPNLSISRDLETSFDKGLVLHDQGITLHHYRCPSVSIIDDNDTCLRSRTFSANSVQGNMDKIPSKMEGMTRHTSVGSLNPDFSDAIMSPSNLSESNFRTPNPESARKRPSFSMGNLCSNLNNMYNSYEAAIHDDKKKSNNLLLPKLFCTSSEDEFRGKMNKKHPFESESSTAVNQRTNSFFGLVKGVFSPSNTSSSKNRSRPDL